MSELSGRAEWRRGWSVVAAAAIAMGTGTGLYTLTAGLFVQPLQQAFGWSRSEIAALGLLGLFSAFMMPVIGLIVDRIGARRVAFAGMILLSLTLAGLSFMSGDLVQLYLLGIVLATAGVATTPIVITRPIAIWFDKARGAALGITMSGVSFTAALIYPLLQYMIVNYGWRAGFLTLAAAPLLVGAPIVFRFLKDRPEYPGMPPVARNPEPDHRATTPDRRERWSDILKDRRFWLLALAMTLANIPVGGILNQLQPMLADKGLAPASAALLGSVFAISIALGRIGAGILLDRLWAPAVAAVCLAVPILGLMAMSAPEPDLVTVTISIVLFGFAQGAEVDFAAYFISRYFGVASFGAIMGVIMLLIALSLAAGGIIFAGIHDSVGNYVPALWIGAGALGIAAVAILATGLVKPLGSEAASER